MKRLLFIISYLDKGGAERALSNITMNLPEEYDIDILVNSDKTIDYQYRGNIISMGMDRPNSGMSLSFQAKVILKRIRTLKGMKKKNRYIASISFLDSANFANILSRSKYCKTIISVRNSITQADKLWKFKYIVNPLSKMLYNKADTIVAVSRGVEIELQQYLGISSEKTIAIENGYPIKLIRERSQESINDELEGVFKEKKVIISVGRLTYQKGMQHLIRVFSKINKIDKDTALVILGDGELRDYYSELIKHYRLENSVFMPGYVENPYKYIAKSTVFVMTSLFEGFPNSMAEAICLGVPCISTDYRTGARELLDPDSIGENSPVTGVRYADYGIICSICSGRKLCIENLEKEEVDLFNAISNLLSSTEKQSHYRKKSLERAKQLEIGNTVQKWIGVIDS